MSRAYTARGFVEEASTRRADFGSFAHSFWIAGKKFTFFLNDPLHPLFAGDFVRFKYLFKPMKVDATCRGAVAQISTLSISRGISSSAICGLIYILSNPAMPDLIKIGFTVRDAQSRARELSRATGVPTAFSVEWELPIRGDPSLVEKLVHARLAEALIGKEFFAISLDEAKSACLAAYAEAYPDSSGNQERTKKTRAQKNTVKDPKPRWPLCRILCPDMYS